MTLTEKRYRKLEECVGFDYVLETHEGTDFAEFVTSMGGDVAKYRVYGTDEDGYTVTCK